MEIHGKEYRLTPIPLRTVRPFIIDELVLEDAAEADGVDVNDRTATAKILKSAVRQADNFVHSQNLTHPTGRCAD